MQSIARIGVRLAGAIVLALGSAALCAGQIVLTPEMPGYPPVPRPKQPTVAYPGQPPVRPLAVYTDRDASVRFDVQPPTASVYVDGIDMGPAAKYHRIFRQLRTSPGSHEITIYIAGYRTYSRRMYLTVEKTFTFRHSMEQLGPSEISARPPAASK